MPVILLLSSMQFQQPISSFAFQDQFALLLLEASSHSTDLFSRAIFVIVILLLVSSSIPVIDAHIIDIFYEHTLPLLLIYAFIVIVGFLMLIIAPHRSICLLKVNDSFLLLFTSIFSLFPL